MTQDTARIARILPSVPMPHGSPRLRPEPAYVGAPRLRREPVQVRKLKYHVNMSADGYILSKVGVLDGFAATRGDDSAQYLQSMHAYGIALMGRRTYESGLEAGNADPYPHLKSFVFSNTLRDVQSDRVELVTANATDWVRRLKTCPGKDIYLCGGAQLATSLLKAGLVDEVIMKVSPILLGSGRRLLSELNEGIALRRESSVAYDDGEMMLVYRVQNDQLA